MLGIVIHCPNPGCKKLLLKEANLPPTTSFKTKCFWCGHMVQVASDYKKIALKDLNKDEDDARLNFTMISC